MRVQLSSSDKMFGFTHAAGTEFAGVAQLKASTFALERDNTAALTYAMLQSDSENIADFKRLLNPPFYPRSRISQCLSRRADKMCFQIDLSSLKDKTDNIPLSG